MTYYKHNYCNEIAIFKLDEYYYVLVNLIWLKFAISDELKQILIELTEKEFTYEYEKQCLKLL